MHRIVSALALFTLLYTGTLLAQAPPPTPTSGAVRGDGTAGKIPKWLSAVTIGDSIVAEDGGRVGIGVAPGAARLSVAGGPDLGIVGTSSAATGITGESTNAAGVFGKSTNTSGVYGTSANGSGVFGTTIDPASAGVLGQNSAGFGVRGVSDSGKGVHGSSVSSFGVHGRSETRSGVVGESNHIGVSGFCTAPTGGCSGVVGSVASGVPNGQGVVGDLPVGTEGNAIHGTARSTSGPANGVVGRTYSPDGGGVIGLTEANGGQGVRGGANGPNSIGVLGYNSGGGPAGQFQGNVNVYGHMNVSGTLSKGAGSFKIDHPLDPANKYLSHAFVESPDMLNIYNGLVVVGDDGVATVVLPQWFEALNRDFRYQLTCIGDFAPVYISQKIAGNRFKIAGGRPGMEVSWQVTGVRRDAYANAQRIPVEELKPSTEVGLYLHPEAFGKSKQEGIDWARKQVHARAVSANDGPAVGHTGTAGPNR